MDVKVLAELDQLLALGYADGLAYQLLYHARELIDAAKRVPELEAGQVEALRLNTVLRSKPLMTISRVD